MGIWVDRETPQTVKVAAVLMVISAILELVGRLAGVSASGRSTLLAGWSPWSHILNFVVSVLLAWLVARLNGLAYWFTVILGGLACAVLAFCLIVPHLRAGLVAQFVNGGIITWLGGLLLVAILTLLVARPSRRAPWGVMKGFSLRHQEASP